MLTPIITLQGSTLSLNHITKYEGVIHLRIMTVY